MPFTILLYVRFVSSGTHGLTLYRFGNNEHIKHRAETAKKNCGVIVSGAIFDVISNAAKSTTSRDAEVVIMN